MSFNYLIGIDEVGRGPIAGPVAVGAFAFLTPDAHKLFRGVKESKQLIEEKREEWFARIEKAKSAGYINYSVVFRSHLIIDSKGLTYAIRSALEKSLNALNLDPDETKVLLDGGLRAPANYKNQQTIIRGDAKHKVIALASICAKVTRDRHMRELAKLYPEYSFETNKGYGTDSHYASIREHGLLPIHRRRFL